MSFHYPLIGDPHLLTDNRGQAVAMAAGLERKLLRTSGDLDAYNLALGDFLEREVLKEILDAEMDSWSGPFN